MNLNPFRDRMQKLLRDAYDRGRDAGELEERARWQERTVFIRLFRDLEDDLKNCTPPAAPGHSEEGA